jgi:hypothetical protein
MCKQRLDSRERFPSGMEGYLSAYGWHFSKKMCDWAVSKMRKKGEKITPYTKEQTEEMLRKHGVDSSNFKHYDHVYVANMAKADYYGSSIEDERHMALFVRDFLSDEDGYEGVAFTRFFADCIGGGEIPDWEDVM